MDSDYLLILLGFIALFLYFRRFFRRTPRIAKEPEAWLPEELKDAQLIGVEWDLETTGDYPLKGRLDRLYQLPDGRLVPVERKNRANGRVYGTDRIQLSLYGYILEMQGNEVAPFGFVVFPGDSAQRVDLLNRSAVERRLERYGQIQNRAALPSRVGGAKCRSCSHAHRCAYMGGL